MLRHVLAVACDVPIPDDLEAARLFDLFASEVALAEPEPGTGALRYREDVRRVILADLRADQPERAARIDQAAIAYYQTQAGAVARAEEIYHLLASGADEADIDARWEPGIEPYLVRSIEELPPRAQVCLANRLRMDLRPDMQDAADQQQWEVSAEQTARALLRDDLPEEALSVLNQRAARLPGSALHLTEAEALAILGQPHTALEVIAKGLASAEAAGDRLLVVNLRLLESLVREGLQATLSNTGSTPQEDARYQPDMQSGVAQEPAPGRRALAKAPLRKGGIGLILMLLSLMGIMAAAFVFFAGMDATETSEPIDAPIGLPPDSAATEFPWPDDVPPPGATPPWLDDLPPRTDLPAIMDPQPQPDVRPPEMTRQKMPVPWMFLIAGTILMGGIWLWQKRRLAHPKVIMGHAGPLIDITVQEPDRAAIRHAAAEAYRVATLTHNDLARLRSIASLLRLHRGAVPPGGPDPTALVAEAEEIIGRIGLSALYDAPGLMRELAAELGMRNPQLLATALRVTGPYVTLPPDLRRQGPGAAAAATSDPRARAILGGMALPEEGMVNALSLIGEAQAPDRRYAMMALATDLLAAELDARRGALPPLDIRQRPLPWRQGALSPQETGWFETTKAAF